jgi:hypothetical protein
LNVFFNKRQKILNKSSIFYPVWDLCAFIVKYALEILVPFQRELKFSSFQKGDIELAEHSAVRSQNDPVRIGVYRHYKHTEQSPKYYLVIGLARHTENEETLVVYVPLYHAGGLRMAARPLSNFTSRADVNGELVERFTYVGTEIPEYSVWPERNSVKKSFKIIGVIVAIPILWVAASVGGLGLAWVLGLLPRPLDAVAVFIIPFSFIAVGFRQLVRGEPRLGTVCVIAGLGLTVVAILSILGL